MARPQIEFLHAQQLPWTPAGFGGPIWRSVQMKQLSEDPTSGACSLLLSLPAGFAVAEHRLAAGQEFLVLDGSFEIDGQDYTLDCYGYLPTSMPRRSWSSREGAVLLCFFDARPNCVEQEGDAPTEQAWDRSQLIRCIDTHNTPWTRHDIDPSVQFLNLAHKVLRHIPATGEKTLLLSSGAQTHPRNWREAQLQHDCAEEMYLLGGDIIGERGTIYEGGYFWRPPGQWHGPFGSRRGSLSLIRFCEGHHQNLWSDQPQPFTLTPRHAPELPLPYRSCLPAWLPPRY